MVKLNVLSTKTVDHRKAVDRPTHFLKRYFQAKSACSNDLKITKSVAN